MLVQEAIFYIKKQHKGSSMNKFIIIVSIIFYSCGIKHVTKSLSDKNQYNTAQLKQKVIEKNNYLNYNWLNLTGNVNINTQQTSQKVKINIKSKKDSLIWASLRSSLGIEVARIKLTTDSLYVINRLAKTYFKKHISILKRIPALENLDLTFQQIQDFILTDFDLAPKHKVISGKYTGNYPFLNDLPDEELFGFVSSEHNYIFSKNFNFSLAEFFYDRFVAVITFSEHNKKTGAPYKKTIKIFNTELSNIQAHFDISYNTMQFDIPQKISFNIPKNYEQIQ